MSRCFPYPPPNYRRSEATAPALIESSKKERKDANEKRKEKKREKRERKESQVMPKHEHGTLKHREHRNKKKRNYDDRIEPNKKSKEALEQVERSGLTEEHGLPCSVREPCESSESTQNSSKSKKHESMQNSSKSRKLEVASAVPGCTTLLLKLPLQKCIDPESLAYNQITTSKVAEAKLVTSSRTTFQVPEAARVIEQSFLSGRTGSQITISKVAEATLVTSSRATSQVPEAARTIEQSPLSVKTGSLLCELNSAKEEPCFSARATKSPAKAVELGENTRIKSTTKSKRHNRAQKLEKRFRDLTVDWKPVPFLLDADIGDNNQGWLYGDGNSHTNAEGCGFSNTNLEKGCGTVLSSFQPRAYYLPELEMYQLPYVVPF